jgi:uncharacterized protein (DUF1778 family)
MDVATCHIGRYNFSCGILLYKHEDEIAMATGSEHDARLNFRLPAELKETIEEAAAQLGQTVSDFAISTLVTTARQVLQEHQVTRLSQRDRDAFMALLDDAAPQPNNALRAAAKRYEDRA